MVISQSGLDCEKKLRDLLCSFFNKEEEVVIKTSFFNDAGKITAFAEIEYGGKNFFGEYKCNTSDFDYYERYKDKFEENAVLKAFYCCAKKVKSIKLPWGVMCGIRPAKNIRSFMEDGYSKNEIIKIFTELYEAEKEKIELAYEVAKNEIELLSQTDDKSVSIYIGIPFCPTRCLYCSFVSTDIRVSGKYMNDFTKKLLEEIEKTAEIIYSLGKSVENIYIGGGTPTTLSEENLENILKKISESFDIKKIKEYTLEAGRVDTINREKLEIAKKYGVNRISINPQTMNNKTLKKINRPHDDISIVNTFKEAKSVGFKCINMDLIAGLPGENSEDFKRSLDKLIELSPENITVHTMCIKRAASLSFADINVHSGSIVSDMLKYAYDKLIEYDFVPYYMYRQKYMIGNLENVGYSKKGCMSVYNINIMEENQTIIALGGGGSSKIVGKKSIERVFNFKDPIEYINRFDEILLRKDKIKELMERG